MGQHGGAIKGARRNKGAAGIDGIGVHVLEPCLEKNRSGLCRQIPGGRYEPQAARRVGIPKEGKGKVGKPGTPKVVDRVIRQAMTQKLSPTYGKQSDDDSHGFRPERSAHDALGKCRENISDGRMYVVDLGLEKHFDTVNHSK
jgi:retron-type reverse transcriptase